MPGISIGQFLPEPMILRRGRQGACSCRENIQARQTYGPRASAGPAGSTALPLHHERLRVAPDPPLSRKVAERGKSNSLWAQLIAAGHWGRGQAGWGELGSGTHPPDLGIRRTSMRQRRPGLLSATLHLTSSQMFRRWPLTIPQDFWQCPALTALVFLAA